MQKFRFRNYWAIKNQRVNSRISYIDYQSVQVVLGSYKIWTSQMELSRGKTSNDTIYIIIIGSHYDVVYGTTAVCYFRIFPIIVTTVPYQYFSHSVSKKRKQYNPSPTKVIFYSTVDTILPITIHGSMMSIINSENSSFGLINFIKRFL